MGGRWLFFKDILSKNLVMSRKGSIFCSEGVISFQMGSLEVYIGYLPYNFMFYTFWTSKKEFLFQVVSIRILKFKLIARHTCMCMYTCDLNKRR